MSTNLVLSLRSCDKSVGDLSSDLKVYLQRVYDTLRGIGVLSPLNKLINDSDFYRLMNSKTIKNFDI